jgi:hypothetical protein
MKQLLVSLNVFLFFILEKYGRDFEYFKTAEEAER